MRAMIQESVPIPVDFPHSADLGRLFQHFVQYWTTRDSRLYFTLPEAREPDTVDLSVRWDGPVRGFLSLRCRAPFPQWLEKNTAAGVLAPDTRDLFGEMAVLYCVQLIRTFWEDRFMEVGPILVRASGPTEWPSREADAACRVEVGAHPVDIRLWVLDRRAEPKNRGA